MFGCSEPSANLLEVRTGLIRTALDLEFADGTVIADSLGEMDCIFLASLYRAEQAIAERLLALSRAKLPWDSIDADKALPWIEQRINLELAPSQKAAVRLALASKVLVITPQPERWQDHHQSFASCGVAALLKARIEWVYAPSARISAATQKSTNSAVDRVECPIVKNIAIVALAGLAGLSPFGHPI